MPDDMPDDLIDRLAAVEGVCCRTCAEEALAALAEWADGALLDPDGWRRLDDNETGWAVDRHDGHLFMPDNHRTWSYTDRVPLHILTPRETTP